MCLFVWRSICTPCLPAPCLSLLRVHPMGLCYAWKCLSTCVPACFSDCVADLLFAFVCQLAYLSASGYLCLPVCLSVCPSFCLSVSDCQATYASLPVCPSLPPVCLSAMCVCLFSACLSACMGVCLSVPMVFCMCIHMCISSCALLYKSISCCVGVHVAFVCSFNYSTIIIHEKPKTAYRPFCRFASMSDCCPFLTSGFGAQLTTSASVCICGTVLVSCLVFG